MNKKGSRLTPKSENGVDSLSLRSASDGDALSERSLPSSLSPRANRYRFRKRGRCYTKHGHQIRHGLLPYTGGRVVLNGNGFLFSSKCEHSRHQKQEHFFVFPKHFALEKTCES